MPKGFLKYRKGENPATGSNRLQRIEKRGGVMKKFALIIICSLIMVLLIGFNYLLWDRENKQKDIETLEHSKASNNASITALGEKINTLEKNNEDLKKEIKNLEAVISSMEQDKKREEEEKAKINEALAQKRENIKVLVQNADTEFLKEAVRKWVEALNQGDYESAYRLQQKSMGNGTDKLTLSEYSNAYKNSIQSININSIELVTDGIPDEKQGEIILSVELEVVMKTHGKPKNIHLDEGSNKRYITVDYDNQLNEWVIAGIFASLQ
jgi:cell division protein FtsB